MPCWMKSGGCWVLLAAAAGCCSLQPAAQLVDAWGFSCCWQVRGSCALTLVCLLLVTPLPSLSLTTPTRYLPTSHLLSHPLSAFASTRRPYLVGTGGGGLELVELDGPIAKVQITGPAANVMTVRVAVTQKLRERIPSIAAVQLVN